MFMFGRAPQDAGIAAEIEKALNGEYSAIACYEQLARLAPTAGERDRILEIRNDEIKHYQIFSAIYTQLTGTQHQPQQTEECATVYKKGLEASIEDEQKTVDFYMEIADQAQNPYIKQQFLKAAADEQNHAVWFLYYYTKSS